MTNIQVIYSMLFHTQGNRCRA